MPVPAVDHMDVRVDVGSDTLALGYRQRPAGGAEVGDRRRAPALPLEAWTTLVLTMHLATKSIELRVGDAVVAAIDVPLAVTAHDGVTVAVGVGYTRDTSEWLLDNVLCDAQ